MFTQKNKYTPFVMWFMPLLFFTYQFILRLWPGLMMQQIMAQFSLDASHFGILAAFFYYGYAGMQIPVAIFLDRFGAKYVVFFFAMLCGVATFLFTYSHNWYLGCLGRFLVGAGSAAGFLSVSKIVSEWFPKNHYTQMIGYSFTIGLMGALYSGKPVSYLIDTYHWKNVELALALVSILIGCSAYFVLSSNQKKQVMTAIKLSYFKKIFSSPAVLFLAVANLLMVGSLEGFSDVWGVPYLMTAYSINKGEAAQLISFVFVGMLFGGPLLSFCSKKLGHYTVIASCGFGTSIAFAMLLLSKSYCWWWLAALFFSIGVMCCYQVIVFAAGSDLVESAYLGVMIAFLNCVNMLGGSFFHTVIGKAMDMFWTGMLNNNGIRVYTLNAYHWALLWIPVCACIGAVIVCLICPLRHKKYSYSVLELTT